MERNITHCGRLCSSKRDLCHEWRPPPFPEVLPQYRALLTAFMRENEGFKIYAENCGVEVPKVFTSTVRTITTPISENSTIPNWNSTTLPVTTLFTENSTTISETSGTASTNTSTTAVTTLSSLLTTTAPAHTAGGTIAVIVIVVLILVFLAFGALWYLWKRKKMRTGSINSLPLRKYEDTNYLDNKARANHSWSPSSNPHGSDAQNIPISKGNDYGSMPHHTVSKNETEYVKGNHKNSVETRVESPREFDKMNTSGFSEKFSFCNENFMNDGDKNEAVSPGVNSQTPLFDMIDGPALPNVVSDTQTVSEKSIQNSDKIHQNGSLSNISGGRSPPVDMSVTKRRISDSSTKSPKKKKPIYLQRKSEPVDSLENIASDMADNRNSV